MAIKWGSILTEVKERWTAGKLRNRYDPHNTHCALGAIGYVMLPGFDERVHYDSRAGYAMLRQDEEAATAVSRLAAKMLDLFPHLSTFRYGGSFGRTEEQNFVLTVNDSLGKDHIVAALEALKAEDEATEETTEVPAIKQPRVEHVTAVTENKEGVAVHG